MASDLLLSARTADSSAGIMVTVPLVVILITIVALGDAGAVNTAVPVEDCTVRVPQACGF
eukprot:COSAG01_NODE_71669_length_255_cov_0.660256_1_plen_59_part_01